VTTEHQQDDPRPALRALGDPPDRALWRGRLTQKQRAGAADLRVAVLPQIPQPVELRAPVDWEQDPFESLSWKAQLHSMWFLEAVFEAVRLDGRIDALARARDVVLDWVARYLPPRPAAGSYAWVDKVVGDRAPRLAYLLRLGVLHDVFDHDEARVLLSALVAHGRWLTDDANYVGTTNHGLAQDVGLLLLADYLPVVPESVAWRAHAAGRFLASASEHVEPDEAIHLEHSPGYHFHTITTLRRVAQATGDVAIGAMADRLAANAGWFVMPGGMVAPLGDTDLGPAGHWATGDAARAQGLRAFPRSGYAMVRDGDSYLIVTAARHSTTHKHADDGSFLLVEHGELVAVEAGKYGFDQDAIRAHVVGPEAHNVLTVEDDEPPVCEPRGSGIRRTGSDGAWHAVEVAGHAAASSGVEHTRWLLYRPGCALVVIDAVAGGRDRILARHLHLGAGMRTEARPDAVGFASAACTGSVRWWPAGGDAEVVTGDDASLPRGWWFPRFGVREPITSLRVRDVVADGVLVMLVAIGAEPDAVTAECAAGSCTVVLDGWRISAEPEGAHGLRVTSTRGVPARA
jgi:hypothetical protein